MFKKLFQRTPSAFADVRPDEVAERLKQKDAPFILDVRSNQEYRQDGHIAGSRLIPLDRLQSQLGKLPKERPIVCVCRSGARSSSACQLLTQNGFADVSNMTGGMMAWKRAGLPTK